MSKFPKDHINCTDQKSKIQIYRRPKEFKKEAPKSPKIPKISKDKIGLKK